jgi:beta-xylosidase
MNSSPAARILRTLTATFAICVPASAQSALGHMVPAHRYRNPVLFADYSDPDVIRQGDDYYLVASTFAFVPGIPILHSRDLVHWQIIGHVVSRLTMSPAYDMQGGTRYGGGVWAPAIRFHNGRFFVYFPTPDEGIFVSTAPTITGPWTVPTVVLAGAGWEDPCPFWDDDGQAYLVHSKKGAGPLILHRMSADGMHLLDDGKVIVEDKLHLPTLEGPKLYKRNGWYYIFAPMGGVGTGDQVVLRSRSIDGPYDYRHVLTQGTTEVNGPHQGAWVEAADGGNWFIHFQKRGAHGRIVWLEPMRWKDDWPVVGELPEGATVGQPVAGWTLPVTAKSVTYWHPQTSDDFTNPSLSPMWEWNHNPDDSRWSLTERRGFLRLHPGFAHGLLDARNTLTESMQDESLEVTARLELAHMADGDRAGLSVFDNGLSAVGVMQAGGGRALYLSVGGTETAGPAVPPRTMAILLRAQVRVDKVIYEYSQDNGRHFTAFGPPVTLHFSWWKGARPALFAFNTLAASSGYVDFDWLHYRAQK